jgi:hypothetical protein
MVEVIVLVVVHGIVEGDGAGVLLLASTGGGTVLYTGGVYTELL